MPTILDEHKQWVDSSGRPLVGGKVYFGVQNADPKVSPQDIFSDRDFATPIVNPQILDANGRTTDKVWIKDRYSILVDDLNDVQQYQELDNGEPSSVGVVTLDNVIGANTISATASPTITAYVDKETYVFKTASINTGAVTLDIDGVGAKSVTLSDGGALVSGQWAASQNVKVIYNVTSDTFIFEQFREVSQAEIEAGISVVAGVISALRVAQGIAAFAKSPRSEIFTASGTWTQPTGVTEAIVTCWGGGASGGGDVSDGGGGAGGFSMGRVTGISGNVTVTVGVGGAAVATGDGNAGGGSSFGAFVTANGGAANVGGAGGAGGAATATGDVNIAGGDAASGPIGGSLGPVGGNAPFGGAGGAASDSVTNATQDAGYPGGGGGGTGSNTTGTTLPGADGCVIVEWVE